MATKNLKKTLRKIFLNSKEKDVTKRTFKPLEYPTNWNRSIKYLNAKDKHLAFNKIFKPLLKEILAQDIKSYLSGGHKLSHSLRKQMKDYAKQKAKEIAQAQITVKAAVEQS